MKRLLGLLILLTIGFYIVWPAVSGYRINTALRNGDADLLASKIDFDSVRASLRPAVSAVVDKEFASQATGLGGPLAEQLKKDVLPKLVEGTLATIVTPANILRIYAEGGDIRQSVARIMGEQMAKTGGLPGLGGLGGGAAIPGGLGKTLEGLGGLGGVAGRLGIDPGRVLGGRGDAQPAEAPKPPAASGAKPSYGLANLKRFAFAGPLGFDVGVAKDPTASEPDLTAGMNFTGLDWKLTRIVPRI